MDINHAVGPLRGLACGDALGRPVEFEAASAIEREHGRVTGMLANGTWNRPAGTVTNDTDLALCVARSLAERGEFDGRTSHAGSPTGSIRARSTSVG
jgi:ADP-ribosyl-[dinitrogen reductase] hydrolase